MRVRDPAGRVTATSPELGSWRVAHDPQPAIVGWLDAELAGERAEIQSRLDSDPRLAGVYGPLTPFCGSVWPRVGDLLVELLNCPIGFAHVAVGATRVAHWQVGTRLFDNLAAAVRMTRPRAVLWQQGESDAVARTSACAWADVVIEVRRALRDVTSWDGPWLVAKSTHHPTAGVDAKAEAEIRRGVDAVWQTPGFARGPDTDVLRGIGRHRAPLERGGHLSESGQRLASLLWWQAVWAHLNQMADVRTP